MYQRHFLFKVKYFSFIKFVLMDQFEKNAYRNNNVTKFKKKVALDHSPRTGSRIWKSSNSFTSELFRTFSRFFYLFGYNL